tara:strand:+ start:137 stop:343 length:207 start_codon:yes stop_codon:yes gene_type:complete
MYYKALADIDSQYTKIFSGKISSTSGLHAIQKDIAKQADSGINCDQVFIVSVKVASTQKSLKEKCERL